MTLFIISYDLIKYKDYPKLWAALEANNAHRVLDSVWVMSANTTPRDMVEWLKQYVDNDDKIFVAKTEPEHLWYTNAKVGTNKWVSKVKETS